ncbi:MAG: sugar phosphate isomerase/epimerase [Thermoguttaceae bacterium]|jgi:sugar phosphate isomerase/epimerase
MNDSRHAPSPAAASRRQFLGWTAAAAASLAATTAKSAPPAVSPAPGKRDPYAALKLGIASYTFRKFSLEQTLAMTKRAGLKYVCLKSMHLPLDAKPEVIEAAVKSVADAGLVLYGCGVVHMHREAEVSQAFDYAKAAGMKIIVAMPTAEMLPAIEQKIKQYDISVAIHNHGPEDKNFPTPESAYVKIKDLDRRLGLCIDVDHTVRAGADPVASIEKFCDRLLDFHMKDVTEAAPKGRCIQSGRGVIDLPAVIRALVKVRFGGSVSFEYEIDENDPLPGLCESVGYTRGVLAAM